MPVAYARDACATAVAFTQRTRGTGAAADAITKVPIDDFGVSTRNGRGKRAATTNRSRRVMGVATCDGQSKAAARSRRGEPRERKWAKRAARRGMHSEIRSWPPPYNPLFELSKIQVGENQVRASSRPPHPPARLASRSPRRDACEFV